VRAPVSFRRAVPRLAATSPSKGCSRTGHKRSLKQSSTHGVWGQPAWLQTLALPLQWLLTNSTALGASASTSRTGKNRPILLGLREEGTNGSR